MARGNMVLWGIHGGRTGDADPIFLKERQLALAWEHTGDLQGLPPNRDAFRERLLDAYPERKAGWYPMVAGQLSRFVHEMQADDLVIYPSKRDRQVHIGRVSGPYQYVADAPGGYVHRRAVKWLKSFPRTKFSQGALYEIGSAMSLFQVKNYADEFLAALAGKETTPPAKRDESISYVAEDIEQNTRDFILKTLAQELKGHALAEFIAHLLGTMGYRTRLSSEGPDGGIDIIAHKDELGFEPPIIKVQVKSTEGSIGDPIVSQLYGKVERTEYGMVVTLGTFTKQAASFARNKSNLRLVGGEELVGLILQHYEQFDSRYKGLLPLRHVYVPEPLEEAEP